MGLVVGNCTGLDAFAVTGKAVGGGTGVYGQSDTGVGEHNYSRTERPLAIPWLLGSSQSP